MPLNYIPLYTGIWNDKNFKKMPNSDCRILFIYLFANPAVTLSGIYIIDKEECQIKSRLTQVDFDKAFTEITTNGKYNIMWDNEKEIIWVMNRFKLIPNKSPKVIAGVIDELNMMTHPFKEKFIELYKDELQPFMWRMKGVKLSREEISTEDFVMNAAKIYNSKISLKQFMMNRGVAEQKIDKILLRILPNLK